METCDFEKLVDAVVPNAEAEDLMLAGLQAMIASEITIRRQALNMTQSDLSGLLGVSQSLVSRWENGETNFTLKTLVDIAAKLGITMQSPFKLTPARAQYLNEGKVIFLPRQDSYRAAGRYVSEDAYSASENADEM